ncbi:hypothetical protein NCTGTJJY_CDS0098 [Serratia phage 92A1]|nr:hypothetical protein NCTGTJJY_CDS0098 [Serratia phage 92A1]
MKQYFNRGEVKQTGRIRNASNNEISQALGLWNAPLETALAVGGDITRRAIGAMNLRYDRKNIVVDVKTHMLMPGMFPGIPGWHTDGVPRRNDGSPAAGGLPNMGIQNIIDIQGNGPRYHLMVLGADCMTKFVKQRNICLDIPDSPSADLYKVVSEQMSTAESSTLNTYEIEPGQVYEWDWWELHTAQASKEHGWRYLIRVTETDFLEPETDLTKVIRRQQQVYVPTTEFGW